MDEALDESWIHGPIAEIPSPLIGVAAWAAAADFAKAAWRSRALLTWLPDARGLAELLPKWDVLDGDDALPNDMLEACRAMEGLPAAYFGDAVPSGYEGEHWQYLEEVTALFRDVAARLNRISPM